MNKYYRRIIYSLFALFFGVFMFIFGGYDDSPGAQGLGLLIFIIGVVGLVKNRKNV